MALGYNARAMGDAKPRSGSDSQPRHLWSVPAFQTVLQTPARWLGLATKSIDDRNAWHLAIEVFWAAILASVASFNSAFALRLGAESQHIALLTSLPALLAIVVSLPAGRFLERRTRRKGWILGSLLLHRLCYALVALLPLLSFGRLNRGGVLVVFLVIMGLPAHFFNVGFHGLLADVIPPRRRAAVFATRNIINVATLSLALFLIGQWLDRVAFPLNYQIAMVGACVAAGEAGCAQLKLARSIPATTIATTNKYSFLIVVCALF